MSWLQDKVFPRVIAFSIHPLHIGFLLVLWVALLALSASWAAFALLGGNYFNGLSGIAACIVLLQQIQIQQLQTANHEEATGHQITAHRERERLHKLLTELHVFHGIDSDQDS